MRLIIEIPNDVVKNETYTQYFNCMSLKLDEVIHNGIPLPKDATNGDIIKALFPNGIIDTKLYTYCVMVKMSFHTKNDSGLLFDKEWWNAPYKMGEE